MGKGGVLDAPLGAWIAPFKETLDARSVIKRMDTFLPAIFVVTQILVGSLQKVMSARRARKL